MAVVLRGSFAVNVSHIVSPRARVHMCQGVALSFVRGVVLFGLCKLYQLHICFVRDRDDTLFDDTLDLMSCKAGRSIFKTHALALGWPPRVTA